MIQHDHPTTVEGLQNAIGRAFDALAALAREGRLPRELEALQLLAPPEGLAARVSLRHVENDRQIKSTASPASWVPGACGVWVEYTVQSESDASSRPSVDPRIRALVVELDAAERLPGKSFVAWKWFRLTHLPARGWRYGDAEAQQLLQSLVEAGWIETRKIENPKNPAFPTATLSLNRQHPQVKELLGAGGSAARFSPVEIRGEPLSTTILRERR
jgi:hypothetical protein